MAPACCQQAQQANAQQRQRSRFRHVAHDDRGRRKADLIFQHEPAVTTIRQAGEVDGSRLEIGADI